MLRLLVLVLVLANGLFFAWSQGLLLAYGWAPARQTEPHRMDSQIQPGRLHLLRPEEVRRVETQNATSATPRPPECLQAGLFSETEADALREALASALPEGGWVLESGTEPARWIVYMGKYADKDVMNRKRGELRGLNIRFEPLVNPALDPGLSLGSHATEKAAREALAQFARRGVRTARVVQERPEVLGQWLKVPMADEALKSRLDGMKRVLSGKPLRPCH